MAGQTPFEGEQERIKQERVEQLRSHGFPAFVKQPDGERAWLRTLEILHARGALDDPITPSDWKLGNAIYQRVLKRWNPALAEQERVEVVAAREVASAMPPEHADVVTKHARHALLELDIGGWYLTRAGLIAHNDERQQRLQWKPRFTKIYLSHPVGSSRSIAVDPLFAWEIRVELDNGTATTRKLTTEIAAWLVRDCAEAPAWMVEQMRATLPLFDEATLDVEHEMPTVGGIEVPHSVLDHRTTKERLRLGKAAVESAINALIS